MKRLMKDNKGFSLVELLIIIAVMAAIVVFVTPSLLTKAEKTRVSKDIQNLDDIAAAIKAAITVESANNMAPSAVTTVASIYDAETPDAFQTEVKTNLPKGKEIAMTAKESKDQTIYFVIEDGLVTVFAAGEADKAKAVKTADETITFSVTR